MKKWILFTLIALGGSALLALITIERSFSQVRRPATVEQSRNSQRSNSDRDVALLSMVVAEQNAVIDSAQRLGVGIETAVFNTSQTREVSVSPETEFVVISNRKAIAEGSPEVAVLDFTSAPRQVALGDVVFSAPERTRLVADRAAGQTFFLIFVTPVSFAGKGPSSTPKGKPKKPLVPLGLSPQCNNNGSLLGSVCLCLSGFSGATCSSCAANHYNYPTCTYCLASTTCKGHGTCTGTGTCACAPGYTGPDCSCK